MNRGPVRVRARPILECFITNKLSTVETRNSRLFQTLLKEYCEQSSCVFGRLTQGPDETRGQEYERLVGTLEQIDKYATQTVILVDENNGNKRWWKAALDKVFAGRYSVTFLEMMSSPEMDIAVAAEQARYGKTLAMVTRDNREVQHRYVRPRSLDFMNCGFANIQVNFVRKLAQGHSVLRPTEECLTEVGRRLFLSPSEIRAFTHKLYHSDEAAGRATRPPRPVHSDPVPDNDAERRALLRDAGSESRVPTDPLDPDFTQDMLPVHVVVTSRMFLVSDKTRTMFRDLIESYIAGTGICLCNVKRGAGTPEDEHALLSPRFAKARTEWETNKRRTLIFIQGDSKDGSHEWWKKPLQEQLGHMYKFTCMEMALSGQMIQEMRLDREPETITETLRFIDQCNKTYTPIVQEDFTDADVVVVAVNFSYTGKQGERVFLPSYQYLHQLGFRLGLKHWWTYHWIRTVRARFDFWEVSQKARGAEKHLQAAEAAKEAKNERLLKEEMNQAGGRKARHRERVLGVGTTEDHAATNKFTSHVTAEIMKRML